MNERVTPRPDGADEVDTYELIKAKHPGPTPEVVESLSEIESARAEMVSAFDDLLSATQSALDIPAKIKRNPVRTAALVGGTGFLLAGGPRRVVRAVSKRVLPQPRPDPNAGILPDEIEKVLKDTGVARDPEVRRALNKDFADYLKQKGKYGPEPNAAASFWRTFDKVIGPLGTSGARIMVQRLMEADQDRSDARAAARERALRQSWATKPTED